MLGICNPVFRHMRSFMNLSHTHALVRHQGWYVVKMSNIYGAIACQDRLVTCSCSGKLALCHRCDCLLSCALVLHSRIAMRAPLRAASGFERLGCAPTHQRSVSRGRFLRAPCRQYLLAKLQDWNQLPSKNSSSLFWTIITLSWLQLLSSKSSSESARHLCALWNGAISTATAALAKCLSTCLMSIRKPECESCRSTTNSLNG